MKRIAYFLSLIFLVTAIVPASMGKDIVKDREKSELTAEEQARLQEIELRVEEIKAMNFSELSKGELKEVKIELKELNKEAKQNGGGIYLSVGAIIVILLVLILLT